MERDMEKLIQKKVMDAERQPVAWRKEQVWVNISAGLQPKEYDRRIYYYAAACVVFLIAAALFFVARMNHLQHIESTAKSESPVKSATPDSTKSAPASIVTPHQRATIPRQKNKITTTPAMAVPETSVAREDNIPLPVADTLVSESVAEVVQPQQKERIKPVIGVFDATESEQKIAVQKKRKKLPLFKPTHGDGSPLENPSENIIARIH